MDSQDQKPETLVDIITDELSKEEADNYKRRAKNRIRCCQNRIKSIKETYDKAADKFHKDLKKAEEEFAAVKHAIERQEELPKDEKSTLWVGLGRPYTVDFARNPMGAS